MIEHSHRPSTSRIHPACVEHTGTTATRRWLRQQFTTVVLIGFMSLTGRAQAQDNARSQTSTILAVDGNRFSLNSEPTFLLGISYYSGLSAPEEFLQKDLDDLQSFGFRWLRVWATWDAGGENFSAVDQDGEARQPYLQKLQSLVAECDHRGLIVDVTLARGKRSNASQSSVHLSNLAAHKRALKTLVPALKAHRNWYLDLANERDVGDDRFVGVDELKELRELARELNPSLLVTASFGGHDLSKTEINDALTIVGCDFLSIHRPRDAESPMQTHARTREVSALMKEFGWNAPIHYQEPFRRGYGKWEPTAADFLTDLRGAITGGAAGWCFHNGTTRTTKDQQPRRSFDLRSRRLFDQLDGEELDFAAAAKAALE